MTNLKTYIEEREELFDNEFYDLSHPMATHAHTSKLIKNFHLSTLLGLLEKDIEMWEGKIREIVGPVDEEFLALPNCEDFVGEWAINKDRQRMVAEFSNLITDRRKLIEELKK